MHRDLKLDNIARTKKGFWKILDFGFSKSIEDKNEVLFGSNLGTEQYKAPEIKKNQPYGTKVNHVFTQADLYSIGVILLKILVNLPEKERTV